MDDASDEIIILDPAIPNTPVTRRFLISQSGLSDDEINNIKQKIFDLQGIVDDIKQNQFNSFCTHIITKDFPVTEKILGALASGKWLLYPRYIHDCAKASKWLDEADYELPNYNFAARHHRVGRVQRGGVGLYNSIQVYVKLEQKSYARAFRRIMAAGGADVLLKEDIRQANLVITDMQHYEVISQQLPPNSNIVGVDYIKDTLIHQKALAPLDSHFLKRAARYQGTPRKPETGTNTHGTLSHYVSNTGYTPTKMLHRIKKEPEDFITAVDSPNSQMRKSIKKIPFTAQHYRNISQYFKTESKAKIKKTDIAEENSTSINQSGDGDLQIIEEHPVVRRQPAYDVMPSSSKHEGTDAIEIMLEIPNKKRRDNVCVIDVDDEITPLTIKPQGTIIKDDIDLTPLTTTKPQGTIIKDDIDLTGDPLPREVTLVKESSSKDTPVIPIIIDSPTVVPISHCKDLSIISDISISSRSTDIHMDSPKGIDDSSVTDLHIPDKVTDSPGSPVTATDIPAGPDISLESPKLPSKSLREPVSPVISTIPRRVKTRPAAIPTGVFSRKKEIISSKPSAMSPTPTTPGSSSWMSLESTSSSPPQSMSTMELCDMSIEEQGNRKRVCAEDHIRTPGSESTSSISEFPSPERLQHSTDSMNLRRESAEEEMEMSYISSPLDVHSPDTSTKMDVDLVTNRVSAKRPSPQKVARKPLLPIDLSNCVDTLLPQSENRLNPVVIRKTQMNSLVLTFMHKENHVSRTVFSDTNDLCAHNDVEENLQNSTPPREMFVKETSLYESSMDDTLKVNRRTIKEQEIIVQGIEYLYVALTPEAFPTPKILGHLLRRLVWQENRFPIIHSRALTLVYRVLDFHPPSCTETRNLYLSTLRYAGSSIQDQAIVNSWTFIREVISSALDMDGDQDSSSESSGGDEMIYKSMNSVRILDFIQTLLQEDLRHWDNRAESMKYLMCIRIFWGEKDRSISDTSKALKVTPQITHLLRLWVKSSQAPPHIRELIARLVGVVLHLMWRCSGTPLVPVSPLPEPLLPLAREILIRFREVSTGPGVSGGCEILRLVQDLTDPWQRTVVLTILFKSVTASTNMKFTLADLLDYGKLVGQEGDQKTEEKTNNSSQRTSKSKKSSRSSVRENDDLSARRVNKTNHKGETALMRACISNKVAEMYKLLAVPGIDINKTDHNGWTALHEAAIRGHNTCVELLLDYKPKHPDEFLDEAGRCNIMKRGKDNGMTALHDAVHSNMVETVKILLEYGGDRLLKVKNKENEIAFDLAETEEMRRILHSYKGKKGKFDMMTETPSTTKRSGGLQLTQISHTSLLTNREECQAFLLLLLNTYLNTTGFRFLLIELNRGLRRSKSKERKQRRAQLIKNNETSNKFHELSSDKDEEDVITEQIDDCFSTVQKSASTGDQNRESGDINCENKNYENHSKGKAFTVFGGKKVKGIPTRTNSSQDLENYDDLLMPSDKAELKNMTEIFNCYLKDMETFRTRKEEFSKDAVDSDFFNSLYFILQ